MFLRDPPRPYHINSVIGNCCIFRRSVRSVPTAARSCLAVASTLKPYLEKLIDGHELTAADSEDAMVKIMEGAQPEQVAALLCLLRMKGETATEIAGCVRGMKSVAIPVHVKGDLLDIVGTGGDGAHTINISTASVILAAAAGAKVCKFGNRSVSSLCGSADVLEALGISVELTPEQVGQCCEECGVAFMFAPNHYPAMKNVAPVRKALGVRTAFNILGPMTNPAGAQRVVIGVFDDKLMPLMAGALREASFLYESLCFRDDTASFLGVEPGACRDLDVLVVQHSRTVLRPSQKFHHVLQECSEVRSAQEFSRLLAYRTSIYRSR